METNLYKVSSICWAVTSSLDDEPHVFQTIEAASEFLESLGVQDEQIDLALVDMLAKDSIRANFGANGTFIFSDGTRLDARFGTA